MKNGLTDLNNHLFTSLERLNDEDLSQESLDFEVSRSKAVTHVARAIIENARLGLEAKKFVVESGIGEKEVPDILRLKG